MTPINQPRQLQVATWKREKEAEVTKSTFPTGRVDQVPGKKKIKLQKFWLAFEALYFVDLHSGKAERIYMCIFKSHAGILPASLFIPSPVSHHVFLHLYPYLHSNSLLHLLTFLPPHAWTIWVGQTEWTEGYWEKLQGDVGWLEQTQQVQTPPTFIIYFWQSVSSVQVKNHLRCNKNWWKEYKRFISKALKINKLNK